MRSRAKYILTLACFLVILPTIVPHVCAEDYRVSSKNIEKAYDISLNWSQLLGSKDWTVFELWDNAYVSFKFNAGLDLSIPANLRIQYPEIIEPNQQFNVETALSLSNYKEVTFSTDFFIKFDLNIPILMPDEYVFGGSWDFKFDLNTQSINKILNTISLGKNDVIQSFVNSLGVSDFVTVENMNINSQTLGRLAFGTIKINFLKAILAVAKTLTSLTPFFSQIVDLLNWLLTDVMKVDTGLKLTPSLNAEIVSPVSSGSELIFNTNNLIYDQDISTKRTGVSVSQSAKETRNSNQINLNLGPWDYRLSFTSDWTYYLDLDINFLNVEFYKNSWSCYLGTMPNLSTDVAAATRLISCSIKLDEPLHADTPQVNNGEVSIGINDNSGISNVALVYSTDRVSWATANMVSQGNTYLATPITSVKQDTTVYYYFEAMDGDNDAYKIDNNGVYYNYLMKPQETSFFDWISDFGSSSNPFFILLLLMIAITGVIIASVLFILRKKKLRTSIGL